MPIDPMDLLIPGGDTGGFDYANPFGFTDPLIGQTETNVWQYDQDREKANRYYEIQKSWQSLDPAGEGGENDFYNLNDMLAKARGAGGEGFDLEARNARESLAYMILKSMNISDKDIFGEYVGKYGEHGSVAHEVGATLDFTTQGINEGFGHDMISQIVSKWEQNPELLSEMVISSDDEDKIMLYKNAAVAAGEDAAALRESLMTGDPGTTPAGFTSIKTEQEAISDLYGAISDAVAEHTGKGTVAQYDDEGNMIAPGTGDLGEVANKILTSKIKIGMLEGDIDAVGVEGYWDEAGEWVQGTGMMASKQNDIEILENKIKALENVAIPTAVAERERLISTLGAHSSTFGKAIAQNSQKVAIRAAHGLASRGDQYFSSRDLADIEAKVSKLRDQYGIQGEQISLYEGDIATATSDIGIAGGAIGQQGYYDEFGNWISGTGYYGDIEGYRSQIGVEEGNIDIYETEIGKRGQLNPLTGLWEGGTGIYGEQENILNQITGYGGWYDAESGSYGQTGMDINPMTGVPNAYGPDGILGTLDDRPDLASGDIQSSMTRMQNTLGEYGRQEGYYDRFGNYMGDTEGGEWLASKDRNIETGEWKGTTSTWNPYEYKTATGTYADEADTKKGYELAWSEIYQDYTDDWWDAYDDDFWSTIEGYGG